MQRRAHHKRIFKKILFYAQGNFINVASTWRTIVTPQTIRYILLAENNLRRTPQNKPFVRVTNRVKRLELAKAYISKSLEF